MNRYTNFILTVIAVALIGILFKGQIIKPVYASCHSEIGPALVSIKNGLNQLSADHKHIVKLQWQFRY